MEKGTRKDEAGTLKVHCHDEQGPHDKSHKYISSQDCGSAWRGERFAPSLNMCIPLQTGEQV